MEDSEICVSMSIGTNAAEIDRIQHQWRAREIFANMQQTQVQESHMDTTQFGELTRRAFAYEKKLVPASTCARNISL